MAKMNEPRAWVGDVCPAWCVGEHAQDEMLADRQHQSSQRWTPVRVIQRHSNADGGIVRTVAATDMCVVAVQYAGDPDPWVAIATETQQMELSPESARVLQRELGKAIVVLS